MKIQILGKMGPTNIPNVPKDTRDSVSLSSSLSVNSGDELIVISVPVLAQNGDWLLLQLQGTDARGPEET